MDQDQELTPYQKHNRQFVTQIWLPIAIATLASLGLLVLSIIAATGSGDTVGKLADISLIMMIIPLFFIFLVGILLTFGIIHLLRNLNQNLPGLMHKGQYITALIAQKTQTMTSLLTLPIIKLRSAVNGTRSFFAAIQRKN
jgi:hypothetical protein